MTTLLIFFLLIPVLIYIGLFLCGVRSRKIRIGISMAVLCLPLLLGFAVYLARTPIQQGKVFSSIGPLLNLVFPPEGLYEPLAEEQLTTNKTTYTFDFSHKYVGNHIIEIIISPARSVGLQGQQRLGVSAQFLVNKKAVFEQPEDEGCPFWSNAFNGFEYIHYAVPKDLPISTPLTVKIRVHGDIDSFLRENGKAVIRLRKSSDE